MKKIKTLAAILSFALIGQCSSVFAAESIEVTKDMKEASLTSGSFKDFAFVYEIIDVINKNLRKDIPDADIRSYGDKLNLENPSQSKVEIIVGDEKSGNVIADYIESLGYRKDILEIIIAPDFIAELDMNVITEADPFTEFKFAYELLDIVNKYSNEKSNNIDFRTAAVKEDLNTPSLSKVEVIVGDEESSKNLTAYVESLGCSIDVLLITVNPDYIIEPDTGHDTFSDFKFAYDLFDIVNEYCKGNSKIDFRTAAVKEDLNTPSLSKVEVIVGNEESSKNLTAYVESIGYSGDILLISVDPDFIIEPDNEIPVLGDIDSDGKVDLTDLSELSLAIIGDKTLTESQIKAADIDENGEADLPDLARLKQYLSKVVTSLR